MALNNFIRESAIADADFERCDNDENYMPIPRVYSSQENGDEEQGMNEFCDSIAFVQYERMAIWANLAYTIWVFFLFCIVYSVLLTPAFFDSTTDFMIDFARYNWEVLFMGVFGMALLHSKAALLQNSRVEQLCSRVSRVFG
jgi:hypothetical protein